MLDTSEFNLPKPDFLCREQIQAIEAFEFEHHSSAFELMQQAGKQVANYLKQNYKPDEKLLFFIGPGNNGGDGYVAVSELQDQYSISILRVHSPKTEIAQQACDLVNLEAVEIHEFDPNSKNIEQYNEFTVVIDSLFGVGLNSQLRSPYDQLVEIMVSLDKPIISVDLPSGLDCNEEVWYGPKFSPQHTISMEFSKQVFQKISESITYDVVSLGFHPNSFLLTSSNLLEYLWPKRTSNSHKGQNGRVMVIGGSDEFTGAPILTGKAVLRCGVDTLRIAVPETIRSIVAGYNQDFIVVKTKGERHNIKSFKKFRNLARYRHDVVVMGMGLSNHDDTKKFVRDLLPRLDGQVKIILDADAIRPFKDHLEELSKVPTILTPHKAELRYLLDSSSLPSDFEELVKFVMKTADDLQAIILLKGEIDIITDGKRVLLNSSGHPTMTVGGTGDVLAGVVSALNCFISDEFLATALAAYVMGKAGELAAKDYSIGALASDIVEFLPQVLIDHGI